MMLLIVLAVNALIVGTYLGLCVLEFVLKVMNK